MRLTVTGLGHLGMVHAAVLAAKGHEVLGYDSDAAKIAALKAGGLPLKEPGLAELWDCWLRRGNLQLTSRAEDVAGFAEAHFLCTGTPMGFSGKPDLSSLHDAVKALVPHFTGGRHLLIGKSTVPPGTANQLLLAAGLLSPAVVDIAWNPEFLAEGTAVHDALNPVRTVIGARDEETANLVREIYRDFPGEFMTVTLEEAELCKLAANAFLATKISFINAIAEYAGPVHASADVIARILGADPRIGHWGLRPGLGFGGGCLPKDIAMLAASCTGNARRLFHAVAMVNVAARGRAFDLICDVLSPGATHPDLNGKRIAVLGAAFKPGTDDTRESPGLWLAEACQAHDAIVTLHDPEVSSVKIPSPGKYPYLWASSPRAAVAGADFTVLATDHPAFLDIDPAVLRPSRKVILDGRSFLDREKWADWEHLTL